MPTNQRLRPGDPDNLEPRCAVVLVLDVSGSMSGDPIRELNNGLKALREDLLKDEVASLRVEVAVVTFGGEVNLAQDFATMDDFNLQTLSTKGDTPMGEALEYALQLVTEAKEYYKSEGIRYYRPWVWLVTDGAPTSPWQEAAEKVHKASAAKQILFYAVAVESADINTLKQIATPERPPIKLNGINFIKMFLWLSASLTEVSRSSLNTGKQEQYMLPPVDWGNENV